MTNYRWDNPYKWLEDQCRVWDKERVTQAFLSLALASDSDTLQDLFQPEMDQDGYFEEVAQ
jgi:activator of HSP90 ATPase